MSERLYEYIPIQDLKDMLEQSGKRYGDNIAYKIRIKKDIYQCFTHGEVRQMINALGTALVSIGLKDKRIAENFISGASKLWPIWISNKDKLALQFFADTIKRMTDNNFLTKKDLYTLSEKEVIKKIENCPDKKISNCFKLFRNSTEVHESNDPISNKYCVSINTKKRYINPLVEDNKSYKRINDVSKIAKDIIDNYLNLNNLKYAYLDFDF